MLETKHKVVCGDSAVILKKISDQKIDLIFIDPPFNTGNDQQLYSSGEFYEDKFEDYKAFLLPMLIEGKRVLKKSGSFFTLLDYRQVHDVKVWMDEIFGRSAFQGEIIWHFETGGQSKSKWSNKHNTILWHSQGTPKFYFDRVPTEKRKAPKDGYTGEKKFSSVWNINMSTTDPQRVGYPSQKPEELLKTIISVHTDPGDTVLDFFAGSGTTGKVAKDIGRNSIMIDVNKAAVEIIKRRMNIK